MSKASQLVEIDCRIIGATPEALRIDDGKTMVWIPRSQIEDWSPNTDDVNKIESIFLPESIATEKGLL